jgi:hypothetical protein
MYFMHIALHTRLPAPTFRVIHSGIYKLSGTHHVREAAPRTGLSFFVFDFSGGGADFSQRRRCGGGVLLKK